MSTLNPRSALVVLSGGQDSTTCLFWAKRYYDEVHAISFDYGQTHSRELTAAARVAKLAQTNSHEFVTMGAILRSSSPLVNRDEQLELYNNHAEMESIIGDRVEKTFVPMRNALFLTIAANRAVALGCGAMVTGVCEADNANYPDCRLAFIQAQAVAINESLGLTSNLAGDGLHIATPLINKSKPESIKLLQALGIRAFMSLAWTHTAYDGGFPPVSKDHASVLRAYGFEQAGLPDPLVIRAWTAGRMQLPDTENYRDQTMISEMSSAIAAASLEHGFDLAD